MQINAEISISTPKFINVKAEQWRPDSPNIENGAAHRFLLGKKSGG